MNHWETLSTATQTVPLMMGVFPLDTAQNLRCKETEVSQSQTDTRETVALSLLLQNCIVHWLCTLLNRVGQAPGNHSLEWDVSGWFTMSREQGPKCCQDLKKNHNLTKEKSEG